jgi:citrate lyase beta subunit
VFKLNHFSYLKEDEISTIFHKPPMSISIDSNKNLLAYALGATLYMPAIRKQLSTDLISKKIEGLSSIVICLEDAIGDSMVIEAEESLIKQISEIQQAIYQGTCKVEDLPLIFIRIRNPEHMSHIAQQLNQGLALITGFVLPKFTSSNGVEYLHVLQEINNVYSTTLYGMPILESMELIYKETRLEAMLNVKSIFERYKDLILNIRIGATDFSGLFGIRRSSDMTIYDIQVIRDCISDIINIFGRVDENFIISGPVWEYFYSGERVLKPMIRESPFKDRKCSSGTKLRTELINKFEDGLIREVLLDKTNGLVGKTIIHPSHIKPVHALHVVTFEEYKDALSIIGSFNGNIGVLKSEFSNKMNEVKPHYNWAKKILAKANVFGVYNEQQYYVDLLKEREKTLV